MKLKFYLIGFGMGALLATAILIISGGLNKTDMTDDEIMARARQLGMVEASSRLIEQNPQGTSNAEISGTTITAQTNTPAQQGGDADASASNTSSAVAAEDASAGEKDEQTSEGTSTDAASEGNAGASEEAGGAGASTVQNEGTGTARGTGIVGEGGAQTGTSQSTEAGSSKSESDTEARANTGANAQSGQVIVTVPDGLYSEGVSELLQQAGAIDDAAAFNNYLIQSGRDRYITPGAKLIPAAATYEEVAKILSGR